jgi:hypothetical protein
VTHAGNNIKQVDVFILYPRVGWMLTLADDDDDAAPEQGEAAPPCTVP